MKQHFTNILAGDDLTPDARFLVAQGGAVTTKAGEPLTVTRRTVIEGRGKLDGPYVVLSNGWHVPAARWEQIVAAR